MKIRIVIVVMAWLILASCGVRKKSVVVEKAQTVTVEKKDVVADAIVVETKKDTTRTVKKDVEESSKTVTETWVFNPDGIPASFVKVTKESIKAERETDIKNAITETREETAKIIDRSVLEVERKEYNKELNKESEPKSSLTGVLRWLAILAGIVLIGLIFWFYERKYYK